MTLAKWGKFMADNPEWWKLYKSRRGFSAAALRNGRPKAATTSV